MKCNIYDIGHFNCNNINITFEHYKFCIEYNVYEMRGNFNCKNTDGTLTIFYVTQVNSNTNYS